MRFNFSDGAKINVASNVIKAESNALLPEGKVVTLELSADKFVENQP